MEWLTCIKSVINYIEDNIKEKLSIDDIAKKHYISTFYLQQGFQIMTGYSIGEYIRNRRLYLAALDLLNGNKVIDVAFDYGYETPESFSKAFKRFHKVSPSLIKRNSITIFNPLSINVEIKGGKSMELKPTITTMFPIKLIGFVKQLPYNEIQKKIPEFWDEICQKYCYPRIYQGLLAENEYEQAILDNCIGEFGVCVDSKENKFKYLIAGKYCGGKIPEGMELIEFKMGEWAIFDCYGPADKKIYELSTKIFKEWLPLNSQYELRNDVSLEWYDCINGKKDDENYHSQIWIPIQKINQR